MTDGRAAIEAILFVAEQPVPSALLAEVLEVSIDEVDALLAEYASHLDDHGHGIAVRRVAGGWRLATRPALFPWVERFGASPVAARLSQAAMECLAVVAYRQPVSRAQVSEIRGVDSESAMRTLERRGLIEEHRRLPLPGNPAVYRTTDLFLEKVDVESIGDLPPLADHVPPASLMERLESTFRVDGD